jgi:hypothetical protein
MALEMSLEDGIGPGIAALSVCAAEAVAAQTGAAACP